ncbi:MAG: hypothetical protein K2N63_01070 [Lachnospiraceae bacterium]|nr:hypothetical protein [Lachnospiraceae bacterium]
MRKHYEKMVQDADKRVLRALRLQNMEVGNPQYGGFMEEDGIYQAKSTIYKLSNLVTAYLNQDCKYYHDPLVFERVVAATDFVRHVQHEDGLFDYVTGNFYSVPDTALCIRKLLPLIKYLRSQTLTPQEKEILMRLEVIVHSGAQGLLEEENPAPECRLILAAVLAACGKLFDCDEMIQAVSICLKEGVGCNEDGQFDKRTTDNANRLNNDALVVLSEALSDPSYEQYAIRNLKMMLCYWEPDDSVFQESSTRFGKERLIFPKDYYYVYLSLGMRYQIPEFLAMANHIFCMVEEKQISSPDFLMQMMNHPDLIELEYDTEGIPTNYRMFFRESGIARVRHGDTTYTVMRGKTHFLYMHSGSIKFVMKLAGSFYEHRAFCAETMEELSDGAIHLHQTMHGGYGFPFGKKQEGEWWKTDSSMKPRRERPGMEIDVVIREEGEELVVELKVSGVKGAPWRVEMAFAGIDRIVNGHMDIAVRGNESIIVKDSYFEASNQLNGLVIGPAFGTHRYTEGREEGGARISGAAKVYFTDDTEFSHTVRIRRV